MSSWDELGFSLSNQIRSVLNELGFEKPTPVQVSTIPLFARNKDVVVEAVTGSGKTLAFLIPILEILEKRTSPFKSCEVGAVVVSPTRELARQIGEALNPFLEGFGMKKFVCTGGSGDSGSDALRFKKDGGNIVIGTPGRLEDLFDKYPTVFLTKTVEVLVLDEADRLLDMGFERSVNFIISKIPKQRRTGLFSATMTNAVGELIRAGLRNPVKVTVKVESSTSNEQKIPDTLSIFYHLINYEQRLAFLIDYLLQNHRTKTMIYFGTCACVDYFVKAMVRLPCFSKSPFKLVALHGKMEHKRRDNVFKEFVNSSSAVLFCTDLAARGLDFPDIDLVIQFDAPQDPTAFVHRCGRTARSGRHGTAIVLLDPNEEAYIDFLEGRKIPLNQLPDLQTKVSGETINNDLIRVNSEDRELYEKSLRAFVSYARFYQEHQAKFIFRFKHIDIGALARSFGLLHLPKMPELKHFKEINFTKVNIDVSTIRFKDKTREKQRKASIARRAKEEPKPQPIIKRKQANEAWSAHSLRKEKKQERKDKKEKKKVAISRQGPKQHTTAEPDDDDHDDDDLEDDYRALKREKKRAKHGQKDDDSQIEEFDSDLDDIDRE